MKTLSLNISERLAALSIFNNTTNKVKTSDLKIYLDDVHKFRLTDEEKEKVKWTELLAEQDVLNEFGQVIIKKGDPSSVTFDTTVLGEVYIDINDFTHSFLNEKLAELEYSANDQLVSSILSLMEKLK